jgi:hypothetical protein
MLTPAEKSAHYGRHTPDTPCNCRPATTEPTSPPPSALTQEELAVDSQAGQCPERHPMPGTGPQ